ncbi:carboxypeptidase-like regulatory domain-containing protein [Gemmata sp.]|uniref:carboxypeptidase-like regulatory domain-containing protein n=1 Tax=Gemmata sp. TaxID=1914242 RepID=UPI003F705C6E
MTHRFHRRPLGPACFLALCCLSGCGDATPKTYRIPGRLVYEDGTPVPGATVVLQTTHDGKRIPARGMANPDGTFELTTFTDKDGVIEGEHDVTVVPLPATDSAAPAKPVVAAKYSNAESSGLKVTVKPDATEILIKVEAPGKK